MDSDDDSSDASQPTKPVGRKRSKYVFDKTDIQRIEEMSDVDEDERQEYIALVRDGVFPESVMDGVSPNAIRIRKTKYRQRLYNMLNA